MPRAFTAQLAQPHGVMGRVVRREMALANAAMVQAAIDLLEVRSGDRVLEIGFGNPKSLARLVELADPAPVVGVDHSSLVVSAVGRELKAQVSTGRLRVFESTADALPLDDQSVDRLLAVNTVTYWPDLDGGFRELSRVASSSARLVIGVRAPAVLRRLGIDGDSVHHLDEAEIVALGARHEWSADKATGGADRIGEYVIVRMLRE